jgi:hypothetical protein
MREDDVDDDGADDDSDRNASVLLDRGARWQQVCDRVVLLLRVSGRTHLTCSVWPSMLSRRC